MIFPLVLFGLFVASYCYYRSIPDLKRESVDRSEKVEQLKMAQGKRITWSMFKGVIFSGIATSLTLVLVRFFGYPYSKALFLTLKRGYPFRPTYVLLTLSLIITLLLLVLFEDRRASGKIRRRDSNFSIFNTVTHTIAVLLVVCSIFIAYSGGWLVFNFGGVSIDQVVYAIVQPLSGTDPEQIKTFIKLVVIPGAALSYLLIVGVIVLHRYKFTRLVLPNFGPRAIIYTARVIGALAILGFGVFYSVSKLGYQEVKAYFFDNSTLFNDYYVEPTTVALEFPDKPKNLIYIFLESMETTYLSTELGGQQPENLLPNLTKVIQEEGINFSNKDLIGGAYQTTGTGFTVGGMVAQTAGVPLNFSDHNTYGTTVPFLPGVYSLGEILNKQGYNQRLFIGSGADFAGRDKYFTQHGDYKIEDYYYAKEEGWIPEDYHVWWGYEDEKLFEFAKASVTELSQEEKPFNFTMLTADTHFEDGYLSENNPQKFGDQYSNVIAFSDQQLGDFLNWLKEQPFYDNTVIVISGDHLSMDRDYFNSIAPDYKRSVLNVILNSETEAVTMTNRTYTTMDLYPTTLAAMGIKITGDRMGLGTNLFSDKPTLSEEIGYDTLNDELGKRSNYYDLKIMKGTNFELLQERESGSNGD